MDIIEQLRKPDICPCEDFSHQTAIDEAADEIERLRGALKEITALPRQKRGSASYAMASIARSALQQKESE